MGNINNGPRKQMEKMKKSSKHRPEIQNASWYMVPVGVGSKNRVYMKFSCQDITEVKDAFAMYDKNCTWTWLKRNHDVKP